MFLKDSSYGKKLGSQLLMTVYKGIAPGEERKALPSLDVNTRRVADGLLQLAFSLSQQVSVAAQSGVSETSSHGTKKQTGTDKIPILSSVAVKVTSV